MYGYCVKYWYTTFELSKLCGLYNENMEKNIAWFTQKRKEKTLGRLCVLCAVVLIFSRFYVGRLEFDMNVLLFSCFD